MPEIPVPDDKDWTFTSVQPCAECAYDPALFADGDIAEALRTTVSRWNAALLRPEARRRPAPQVWSPLEYACHIRDVHTVFTGRVARMRTEDTPHFASWDGDEAAVDCRYFAQDPGAVASALAAATEAAASEYDAVRGDSWSRSGIRGDGGTFTISSLGHYHLHDVLHHLYDVRA